MYTLAGWLAGWMDGWIGEMVFACPNGLASHPWHPSKQQTELKSDSDARSRLSVRVYAHAMPLTRSSIFPFQFVPCEVTVANPHQTRAVPTQSVYLPEKGKVFLAALTFTDLKKSPLYPPTDCYLLYSTLHSTPLHTHPAGKSNSKPRTPPSSTPRTQPPFPQTHIRGESNISPPRQLVLYAHTPSVA